MISCKRSLVVSDRWNIFFIKYKYGDFIHIQEWVLTTTFATTLATTLHIIMFTCGSLKMWHMTSCLYVWKSEKLETWASWRWGRRRNTAGFVLKRQGVLQRWCQRTEVTFRLLRWAQTSFWTAARWFARRGQKTTSSAASYFEPRTLCSRVEGPGCISILNFEQLISSCNLEVELEASSLLFFFPFACCKLFRSKILHVLFVSALSYWRSFQSNCTHV